ncbi:DUF6446 family protein [Paracoccus marinaquae]|uniref:Histidine kinase n=1 Tax=Paracoccus marinaquae TaxID=2841926 RepID=A0ABS6AN95_9RHOB|nr:DUF6446 family protein [Paracoccus marinaquae]MBU3032068.1 histidine kinase [Paracoccus marinaquae]
MSQGKIAVSFLILSAVLTALAVYYLQVYGYYEEIDELAGAESLLLTTQDGSTRPIRIGDFKGIDADSSPLRYRACFTVDPAALADARPYPGPTPLIGPNWFQCYSAKGVGRDLESGAAEAFLSQAEIRPGVDRVIAVYPDGRGFAWHQLNENAEEKKVIE